MAKNIAIIPARGGSKRLPGKNVRNLKGIPLIAHSILYAFLYPELIDEVYVSTDCAEIKKTALNYGAKVIDRPPELSTDTTPTIDVLRHLVTSLEAQGEEIDNVILLQCTNPLSSRTLLAEVFAKYQELGVDSAFTVGRSFAKLGKIVDNKYIPYNYQIGQRSQDLEPLYFEDGVLYLAKASLIRENILLSPQAYPYENKGLSVDIDTIEEFEQAEYLFDRFNIHYYPEQEEA